MARRSSRTPDPRLIDPRNRVALSKEVMRALDVRAGDYIAFTVDEANVVRMLKLNITIARNATSRPFSGAALMGTIARIRDMAESLPEFPGVTFDRSDDGHVVFAYCQACGQQFVPQTPAVSMQDAWRVIREKTKHGRTGCRAGPDFIALT